MSEIVWQVGYGTKAALTNAPTEAKRVPTRLPNEKGEESAMAALVLVADAEDVPLDATLEAEAFKLSELTTMIPNQSRECGKRWHH